jgi:gas vesicle protein
MLIGAIIGAGISMLYAPRSGAETRAAIKERAKEVSQKTSDTINRAKTKIAEMRGKAEEKAQEMKSKAESM